MRYWPHFSHLNTSFWPLIKNYSKILKSNFFPPPIAFFVLQKGIEGGLEEIVVCGVVCIVYSILPLRVLLNLKKVLDAGTARGQKCLNCRW